MNACFCNGIQNPPTWRVFLLEWVAVLRVEWVAGLVSLQVEGFDRYVWLSWGGIRSLIVKPKKRGLHRRPLCVNETGSDVRLQTAPPGRPVVCPAFRGWRPA